MKLLKCILFVLSALLIFTIAAVAADDKPINADVHDHGTWKEKRFVTTPGSDGVQRVEIVGGEYYYDPNYIVVKVNRPVEMKVKKAAGYIPHDLIVKSPEAGMDFKIDMTGDPKNVKFTPTKVGKYPMYCDKSLLWFKTHREKGMEGVIEVVE